MTLHYEGLKELFEYDMADPMMPSQPARATTGGASGGDEDLSAFTSMAEEFEKTMGTAKQLSEDTFRRKTRRVYRLFSEAGVSDESKVRSAMAYYFLVHGLSDKTKWSKMEDVVVAGARVPPSSINEIALSQQDGAEATLRNFARQMLHYEAGRLIKIDSVRQKMMERALRVGLTASEVDAINEMSLDYDPQALSARIRAKYGAVTLRERSGPNVTERAARSLGDQVQEDARNGAPAPSSFGDYM